MTSAAVINTTVFFSSVENGSPAYCLQFATNPSVHVYHALKAKISQSTDAWIKEFVDLGVYYSF